MSRKPKVDKPGLREKLSQDFLATLQKDFEANREEVIQALRKENPTKYAELIGRLIQAQEPQAASGRIDLNDANSMYELGFKLLLSVHMDESKITDDAVTRAIAANDVFVATLQTIAEGH
jgi:hypothetical protein